MIWKQTVYNSKVEVSILNKPRYLFEFFCNGDLPMTFARPRFARRSLGGASLRSMEPRFARWSLASLRRRDGLASLRSAGGLASLRSAGGLSKRKKNSGEPSGGLYPFFRRRTAGPPLKVLWTFGSTRKDKAIWWFPDFRFPISGSFRFHRRGSAIPLRRRVKTKKKKPWRNPHLYPVHTREQIWVHSLMAKICVLTLLLCPWLTNPSKFGPHSAGPNIVPLKAECRNQM